MHFLFFCILNCVPIKSSYKTHGGNSITAQLIIKLSRNVLWVCGVSSWLRTRSLTRSALSLVRVLRGPPLSESVDWAVVSELLQQPVNATFVSCVCLKIYSPTSSFYIPPTDTIFHQSRMISYRITVSICEIKWKQQNVQNVHRWLTHMSAVAWCI